MNPMKYVKKSKILFIVSLICLEQGFVALSTLSIIKATEGLKNGRIDNHFFILFLIFLFIPYVPGFFARRMLEESTLQIYHDILMRKFIDLPDPEKIWMQRTRKDSFMSGLGAELLGQLRQVTTTFFDTTTLILNSLLNISVLSLCLNGWISIAFATGSSLAFVSFVILARKSRSLSENNQSAKNGFMVVLSRGWDNILLNNLFHRKFYCHKLEEKFQNYRSTSLKTVTLLEGGSLITTYILAAPVIFASLYLFLYSDAPTATALAFTLPRQFQIVTNIQALISYLLNLTAIKQQFKGVLSLTEPESFDLSGFIKFNQFNINGNKLHNIEQLLDLGPGRHTIRGPNGSGKSVSLALIKHRMGKDAYLLPASSDLYLPIETRGLSSGQRTLEYLRAVLRSPRLPRVILLDEWDAHLDSEFRHKVDQEIELISSSHVVIEIRHGS
jgi:hypothetical protein